MINKIVEKYRTNRVNKVLFSLNNINIINKHLILILYFNLKENYLNSKLE